MNGQVRLRSRSSTAGRRAGLATAAAVVTGITRGGYSATRTTPMLATVPPWVMLGTLHT